MTPAPVIIRAHQAAGLRREGGEDRYPPSRQRLRLAALSRRSGCNSTIYAADAFARARGRLGAGMSARGRGARNCGQPASPIPMPPNFLPGGSGGLSSVLTSAVRHRSYLSRPIHRLPGSLIPSGPCRAVLQDARCGSADLFKALSRLPRHVPKHGERNVGNVRKVVGDIRNVEC